MIKRTSLVWKRPELTCDQFRELWLGEHVDIARRIPGACQYVIDFIPDSPPDLPSGIAVLRFENEAAMAAAFADPDLVTDLHRTRDDFAARVAVFVVDETVVFERHGKERA